MGRRARGSRNRDPPKRLEDVICLSAFDEDVITETDKMYCSINRLDYSRVYSIPEFYLACLYLVHKRKGCPLTIKELFYKTEYVLLDEGDFKSLKWKVTKLSRNIARNKNMDCLLHSPNDYLDQFCKRASEEFGIPEEDIKESSESILDSYLDKGGELTGRPSSYASTVVYIVTSKYFAKKFTPKTMNRVFDIDIQTILKKKKDLELVLGESL